MLSKSVSVLLQESCERHSSRIAISSRDPVTGKEQKTTYGALLEAALEHASRLRSSGLSGQAVLLPSGKDHGTYVSLLGIWLSGNYFVPIPNGCPPGRLEHIRRQAVSSRAPGSSLAYMMFTSGSTGQPKGCRVTHENLLAYLAGISALYDFSPADRISQVFDLSFDPGVSDILWAFLNGATLCPLHYSEIPTLHEYLEREAITVWSSSPSLARLVLDSGGLAGKRFPLLRQSSFIGEKLPLSLVKQWLEHAPGCAIENLYGPLEATISVSRFRIEAGADLSTLPPILPIGSPYPGVELHLEESELLITGRQVADGYLDEQLNELRFFGMGDSRSYRTGDLCTLMPDGNWMFLGRKDSQCKIFGQRFEAEEVERVAEIAGISGAVALPWPSSGTAGFESFVLVSKAPLNGETLEKWKLAGENLLPAFARPSAIFLVEALPLSSSGKLDRPALAKLVQNENAVRLQ